MNTYFQAFTLLAVDSVVPEKPTPEANIFVFTDDKDGSVSIYFIYNYPLWYSLVFYSVIKNAYVRLYSDVSVNWFYLQEYKPPLYVHFSEIWTPFDGAVEETDEKLQSTTTQRTTEQRERGI